MGQYISRDFNSLIFPAILVSLQVQVLRRIIILSEMQLSIQRCLRLRLEIQSLHLVISLMDK